jgi:peptide/nickel transport system substrate-binding protein
MHTRRSIRRQLQISIFFIVGLAISTVIWALPAIAQDKPASETKKDDQPKKPKPPVREEQEESKTPTIKKRIEKVDDDDVDVLRPKPAKLGITQPADLEPEAQNAKHQAIKELFHLLATPRDVVIMQIGTTVKVDPIPEFIGPQFDPARKVHLQAYDDKGKPAAPQDKPLKDVVKIHPYEEVALTEVDNLMDRKSIPRLDLLQAAEKALTAVVRFHSSARQQQLRKGDAWNELEKRLRDKLIAVQLEQLQNLADANEWEKTYGLAARLGESYSDKELRGKFAALLARVISASLKAKQYGEARSRTKMLEQLFPDSSAVVPVTDDMKLNAAGLFDQAKLEKDPTKALKLIAQAEIIWPDLPGLRDYRLKLSNTYPVLIVGVSTLPEMMSPATAVSDSEKQAVELIFESLVKSEEDPTAGQLYVPGLALENPRVIPLGREFQLFRDARWSNDPKEKVRAEDVIRTVQLLRNSEAKSFAPEWADLVDNPPPNSDPFTVSLTLRQGYLDPLSLMLFKILPAAAHLDSPDDPRFARRPIGSGPFQLQGKEGNAVVFTANPYYERANKPGLPHLREIRFVRSDNPARDFADGKLHLLLDLPTDKINQMKSVKGVTVQSLPNRRIYFLAVNHRSRMLQNEDLRRTIAHVIDRTKILNEAFRGDLKSDPMPPFRPLNGPYPPGSWACKPNQPADPFDPALAKVLADKVKSAASVLKLSLKYPDDDPRVKRACEMIRDEVAALGTGLRIDLEPKAARLLHDEIEFGRDYELAYYYYDYPTEAYWLWPLFNTNPKALVERGGKNFLGYQNDGQLESLFIKSMGHRDFQEVQRLTHEIHAHLFQKMPLIPLWQLDTHIAIHNDLKPVRIDPLLVFTNVEQWKLEKKQ